MHIICIVYVNNNVSSTIFIRLCFFIDAISASRVAFDLRRWSGLRNGLCRRSKGFLGKEGKVKVIREKRIKMNERRRMYSSMYCMYISLASSYSTQHPRAFPHQSVVINKSGCTNNMCKNIERQTYHSCVL